ncbi:MAG: hypothetical protein ACRYFW_12705 [Janthinobacterium lividum]
MIRPAKGADARRLNRAYKVEIAMIAREPMPRQQERLLDATIDRMLGMVDRCRSSLSRDGNGWTVTIAGTTIMLDPRMSSFEHALERLASAIEAAIAYQRATAMLAAARAETGSVPLWLVTGSSVLAGWLAWSRGEAALHRVLMLSDQPDIAPVVGTLRRTARVALGQTAVAIRVSNGFAVAGKIELPAERRCIMALGRTARMTIAKARLPEAMVAALAGRSMTALASHPFFTASGLVITAAHNEGQSLVVELEHDWRPLAPVPEAALAVVPTDADLAVPWRATRREVADLYGLVDGLRGHKRTA